MFTLNALRQQRSARRGQRGNVTLFGIGLGIMILAVGGLSMDLWQIVSTRKALTEVADAAAAAGANQIDFDYYRANGDWGVAGSGRFLIDKPEADAVGRAAGVNQPEAAVADSLFIEFNHDNSGVVAIATGTVDFTFLSIISGADSLEMQVTSRATPRRTLAP